MMDRLLEKDIVPDGVIRLGIRRLLRQRLRDEAKGGLESRQRHEMELLNRLKRGPIAVDTSAANEQHYEVPTDFYQLVLGKHLKYSCGWWDDASPGVSALRRRHALPPGEGSDGKLPSPVGRGVGGEAALDVSEEAMLRLTCERAELDEGQEILELGCGWGSLSLFMAARYPGSRITVVSNSRTQKAFIDSQAAARGLKNLTVLTEDMNRFEAPGVYDRVVSVEMFEHMRNHEALLSNIARWLAPGGKLFVHIFTHREFTYLFEPKGASDWMSRYFFTGGMMPSDHYLLYFQKDLKIEDHWRVSGTHYQKTSEAWLSRMDAHRAQIVPLFETTYGKDQAVKWWAYWRVFFMSCAELWGFRGGTEWFVSHYRFVKP